MGGVESTRRREGFPCTQPQRAVSRRPPPSTRLVEPSAQGGSGPQGAGLDGRPFSLRHGGRIENPRPERGRAGASAIGHGRAAAPFPKRRWSRSGEGGGRRLFRPRNSAASNAKGEPTLRKRKRQSARRRKPLMTRRGGAARDRAAAKSLRHEPARRVI